MKAKSLLISIFAALCAMLCALAVNADAGIYVFPEEIDLAIDTLRPGKNPSYTLYSTETEKYYAEVDGWSDISGQPIASSAVLQSNASYKLLLTVTAAGDYSLSKEVPCFVNGVSGSAVKQISRTKVQYEVTLPVYDYEIIDMFELRTEIYHGMSAKDYDKIVKILTPHVEFTADTKKNGLHIENLTNESDKSGVFKYGNSYYVTFSVQPEAGYDFALSGTVNMTGIGPYALNVKYMRDIGDNIWVIGIEVLTDVYPIEIKQVDLEFEPQKYSGKYDGMLRCKTENVKIKNPFVTYQGSGREAGVLLTGDYNLEFELQAADGYVFSKDCKINMTIISMDKTITFTHDAIEQNDKSVDCALKFHLKFFDCIAWLFRQIGKWFK